MSHLQAHRVRVTAKICRHDDKTHYKTLRIHKGSLITPFPAVVFDNYNQIENKAMVEIFFIN